jgi:hypothetical protein
MRNVVYLSDRSDRGANNSDGAFALPRLELEMAMDLGGAGPQSWIDVVRDATAAAGGDLLFVLPNPTTDGEVRQRAMVRLHEDDRDCLVFICQIQDGYTISDEDQIDPVLAEFAQATIKVMQHLSADDRVTGPLAEALH